MQKALCLSLLAACGASSNSAPDATTSADAAVAVDAPSFDASGSYPAFTPIDQPQAIDLGGPILATPTLVPIFFANDDATVTTELTTFLGKLPGSSYWTATTSEYGVGAVSVDPTVQLGEGALATQDRTDIETWLSNEITTGGSLPAPDANTVYLLFYPSSTTITDGVMSSCNDFGGFHHDVVIGGTDVAYVVLPRCADFLGLAGIEGTTAATSHEIVEAVTDPYPATKPAYFVADDNHWAFERFVGGGEIGDLCAQFSSSFYVDAGLGRTVQRVWSNAAARAGHDPCVPAAITPYFNSMPVLATVPITVAGVTFDTEGVHIPVGASQTVEVDLFSDAPTAGPWTVNAIDGAAILGGAPHLGFSWDRTTGVNGDKLHLTITALSASTSKLSRFMLTSKVGTATTFSAGLVVN